MGDLATWFTGLVTLGAFGVAFVLLMNELRSRRREQAEKVVVVYRTLNNGRTWQSADGLTTSSTAGDRMVTLVNNSDQPILNPEVVPYMSSYVIPTDDCSHFYRSDQGAYEPGGADGRVFVLMPGETVQAPLDHSQYRNATYVTFLDGRGRRWTIDLVTRRLRHRRRLATDEWVTGVFGKQGSLEDQELT